MANRKLLDKKGSAQRRCRAIRQRTGKPCNVVLPVTRYFHCERCVAPETDYSDMGTSMPGINTVRGAAQKHG